MTYAMLAGHSPFEAPGSAESVFDLARRIVKDPVPPLGRPEAPPSLFRVLSIAMDKDPSRRYRTVLAFARALQQVESELGLPITAVDLYSDSLPAAGAPVEDGADDDSAATRIGVFSRVDAQVPSKTDAELPVAPDGFHKHTLLDAGLSAATATVPAEKQQ